LEFPVVAEIEGVFQRIARRERQLAHADFAAVRWSSGKA
jgi:hypothetical protein